MNLMDMIFWVVLPYSVILIGLVGLIWKVDSGKGYESRKIKVAFILVMFLFLGTGAAIIFFLENEMLLLLTWFEGLLTFNPKMELLCTASSFTKIHIVSFFSLLLLLPFTRTTTLKQASFEFGSDDEDPLSFTKWN